MSHTEHLNYVEIPRLDGGINSVTYAGLIELDESPDSLNVIYDDIGAVQKRKGRTKLLSTILNEDYKIDGIHSFIKSGVAQLLTISSGNLYKYNNASWELIPSGSFESNTDKPIHTMTYQSKVWISDGVNRPMRYDGTELKYWSIISQTGIPDTTVTGSLGYLSGFYRYKILPVDSMVNTFSNDYLTSGVHVNSGQVQLSNIPVYPSLEGCDELSICRNIGDTTIGSSGLYYVIDTISNGTTTYLDNISDLDLDDPAPLLNNSNPSGSIFLEHNGYIFMAGVTSTPDTLYFSNIDTPEVWNPLDILVVGDGDGYTIKGLTIHKDNLVIFKSDKYGLGSVYALYMPTNNSVDWQLERLDTNDSCPSQYGHVKYNDNLVWFNSLKINEASKGLTPISYNITSKLKELNSENLQSVISQDWDNKLYFNVPSDVNYNNYTFVYDYVRGKNVRNRDYSSWSIFDDQTYGQYAVHSGQLLSSDANNGYVYVMNDGYTDDGESINGYYTTPYIASKKNEFNEKNWRHIHITTRNTSGIITVNYRDPVNQSNWPGSQSYTINLSNDYYNETIPRQVNRQSINLMSRVIQLKISNDRVNEYFIIDNIKLYYRLRGTR